MILSRLINNIALLLTLCVVYNFIFKHWTAQEKTGQIYSGFLFGIVACIGMALPLTLHPGVIFDGRTLIMAAAGLFAGPPATAIAVFIAGVFRLYMGGSGVISGILSLITSALLGLLYNKLRAEKKLKLTPINLYIFGIIVHIVMLLCLFALPWSVALNVLKKITFPVLFIYPLGFLILGIMFREQEIKAETQTELEHNRFLLQQTLAKLRKLNAQRESRIELEKSAIARQMQDELGQVMSALKMDLNWLGKRIAPDDMELQAKTHEMADTINKQISLIKNMTTRLKPGILDNLGLISTLEWYGAYFQERTGIQCNISVQQDDIQVGQEHATVLFRIFQQVLNNCRSLQTKKIDTCLLRRDDGALLLTISYDAPELKDKSNGQAELVMFDVEERVKALNGISSIDTTENHNEIVINLPLNPSQETLGYWHA